MNGPHHPLSKSWSWYKDRKAWWPLLPPQLHFLRFPALGSLRSGYTDAQVRRPPEGPHAGSSLNLDTSPPTPHITTWLSPGPPFNCHPPTEASTDHTVKTAPCLHPGIPFPAGWLADLFLHRIYHHLTYDVLYDLAYCSLSQIIT